MRDHVEEEMQLSAAVTKMQRYRARAVLSAWLGEMLYKDEWRSDQVSKFTSHVHAKEMGEHMMKKAPPFNLFFLAEK
jgi:hypothetical protein